MRRLFFMAFASTWILALASALVGQGCATDENPTVFADSTAQPTDNSGGSESGQSQHGNGGSVQIDITASAGGSAGSGSAASAGRRWR